MSFDLVAALWRPLVCGCGMAKTAVLALLDLHGNRQVFTLRLYDFCIAGYLATHLSKNGMNKKKRPIVRLGVSGIESLTMTYFHTGIRTIIGAKSFHGPVRDGKEWFQLAMVVRQKLFVLLIFLVIKRTNL